MMVGMVVVMVVVKEVGNPFFVGFRMVWYGMVLFFGMVLFLYQDSTSTFGGPHEVTMADNMSGWVRLC
jgi:hypothetical protein